MSLLDQLPKVRGRYSEDAALGSVGWFRTGGSAEILYKPADREDLQDFLKGCPKAVPVMTLGVLSNTIVRDGGVKGVVVRLGRDFADIKNDGDNIISAGAVALDVNVALKSAQFGIGGLEFLSGIPGSIGGALRMNAGAYGTETKDVLLEAQYVDRSGNFVTATPEDLKMTYRHTQTPEGAIFVGARFQGFSDEKENIERKISEIKTRRAESQPIKSKTGGSTFANPDAEELVKAGLPEDMRVWQLIDKVGGRGLMIGGAQMSEKHCNFMINTGTATAKDLENLGEEIKRRVFEDTGIMLRWEIRRIGEEL
ncbi:MAG: UDP-N-acetylmuramate dehydrogenase [Bdellovibrionales bacterium]